MPETSPLDGLANLAPWILVALTIFGVVLFLFWLLFPIIVYFEMRSIGKQLWFIGDKLENIEDLLADKQKDQKAPIDSSHR